MSHTCTHSHNLMNLTDEPGWIGSFTRDQAEGAIPNGTRIIKAKCEPGDSHPTGAKGTVLGSFATPPGMPPTKIKHLYFIEWDDLPRHACGTVDWKIAQPRIRG